jgi:hypothetical protein
VIDVDGWSAIRILQEGHLDVAAATDILRSLRVVVIPLAGAGEVDAAVAAVEVTNIDSAVWDTAKLAEATGGGQPTIIKAERACMCLMKGIRPLNQGAVWARVCRPSWEALQP